IQAGNVSLLTTILRVKPRTCSAKVFSAHERNFRNVACHSENRGQDFEARQQFVTAPNTCNIHHAAKTSWAVASTRVGTDPTQTRNLQALLRQAAANRRARRTSRANRHARLD